MQRGPAQPPNVYIREGGRPPKLELAKVLLLFYPHFSHYYFMQPIFKLLHKYQLQLEISIVLIFNPRKTQTYNTVYTCILYVFATEKSPPPQYQTSSYSTSCHINGCSMFCPAAVQMNFEQTSYQVTEDVGTFPLCVQLNHTDNALPALTVTIVELNTTTATCK